jgi:hypothetical protein
MPLFRMSLFLETIQGKITCIYLNLNCLFTISPWQSLTPVGRETLKRNKCTT